MRLPKPVRVPKAKRPIARKSRTRIMPKCKHCAHPFPRHCVFPKKGILSGGCFRCDYCPGYEPARGIRQKRRGPAAAIKQTADALWSKVVKLPQRCDLKGVHPHECQGPLEAMHMIPRTFAATRWLPINGVVGCSDVHLYFTKRPELWSAVCLDLWGVEVFRNLWRRARAMEPVDMESVVASLRSELEKASGKEQEAV